jgi:hypothetical protein
MDYSLESAYQFGNFVDKRPGPNTPTGRLEQSAYMVAAQGGYTFTDIWATPRLGLEYDFSSGDSDPFDDKHETLDNLFPTNHKFYGYMDFVSLQNIHDVRGILQLKPHPRLSVAVEGHGFWLADTHDNFYNVAGAPRGGTGATPLGNGYGVNPRRNWHVDVESTVPDTVGHESPDDDTLPAGIRVEEDLRRQGTQRGADRVGAADQATAAAAKLVDINSATKDDPFPPAVPQGLKQAGTVALLLHVDEGSGGFTAGGQVGLIDGSRRRSRATETAAGPRGFW